MESSEGRQPLSLKMTVDLGGGKQDVISITDKDDPAVLAREFGDKHHLSRSLGLRLRDLIAHNLSASHRYLASRNVLAQSQSFEVRSKALELSSPRNNRTCTAKRPTDMSCSFRPKINCSPAKRKQRTEDLLIAQGAKRDEKVRCFRNRVMQEQLQKCTFHPALNQRSTKLALKRRELSPAHETLFRLAAEKKEKESVLNPFTYTFHPETYSVRKQAESTEQLLDRLTYSKTAFNAKIEKMRKKLEPNRDPSTGQQLFAPRTGRGPRSKRDSRPASERLYSLRNHKKAVSFQQVFSRPTLPSMSEGLVRQYRSRQVGKLFRLLDSDRDGVISSETVEVSGLQERAFLLLEPLWNHLRDCSSELTLSDFERQVERLLLGLSIEERDYLLRSVDPEESLETSGGSSVSARQPQLSPVSLAIAANRYSDSDPYTRQVEERRSTQQKLAQIKKAQESLELAECSFRPTTTKYVRRQY